MPSGQELKDFEAELRAEYTLSEYMLESVKAIPSDASPMHVVRSMVSNLALEDPDCNDQSLAAEPHQGHPSVGQDSRDHRRLRSTATWA